MPLFDHLGELRGASKKKESVLDIFKVFGALKQRFGQVYVNFGEPIRLAGFLDQAPALDLHLQHHGFDIAREHDVAAAAEHEQRLARQAMVGQQLVHILRRAHAHQRMRACGDAEAVTGLQGDIFLD